MTSSIVKKAENISIADDNRVCSNGGSGKDRCSDDMLSTEGRGYTKKPLCYGCGQEGE